MKKLIFVVILLAIIALSTALYFFISHFSSRVPITQETPSASISPMQTAEPTHTMQTPTQAQSTNCMPDQLSAQISTEGAAGNIYGTLELLNIGNTACSVELGNTITAAFDASNIVLNQKQTVASENFLLAPGAKVYSQIHYPNGPQCQTGITPKPISFLYKTSKTSVAFKPVPQTGIVQIQTCNSQTEKTTVDIWPLSKTPVTQ